MHAARRVLRATVGRVGPADRALRVLRRTDEVAALQAAVAAASAPMSPFLELFPAGHFYSPVPDAEEIRSDAERLFHRPRQLPGVALRPDTQRETFTRLAPLAGSAGIGQPGDRYQLDNPNYGAGDALILAAMLRDGRPRRYLEIGSGHTTALALDVSERHLGGELQVTAIEPYPELLRSLLRPDDQITVLAQPVQSVGPELVAGLGAGDVLFIDSSHVLKTGSDVQYIYGELLPLVAEGVVVHVHDIFWPFEYLEHWVAQGRAWNEAYLLQAFLSFNSSFEVVCWNHYLAMEHADLVSTHLPEMVPNPGGAFWMRRTQTPS